MKVATHVGATIASLARAVAITFIAALCVVRYSLGALRRLAMRDREARARHRARSRGTLLRWSFAQLGASFVKIGQIASSRPDLFCAGVIAELRALQDRVPAFAFRRVRATVERELHAPIDDVFAAFDREPIAAGGIAQVHRAVLRSGDEVAVKVLRPGVRARLHRDARLILWLAHFIGALSARARAADVVGHARSLVAGLLAQPELAHEARNYQRFRDAFDDSRAVAFPRVYSAYSTDDMLTMEFVHGVTLDRVPPRDVARVTSALRDAFFAMVFEHGLVHADLHPGNILVRDDGVVVLLDVGLVKYLPASVTDQVVDFARCMVMGDAQDLVTHLRKHHRYLATTDWDAVTADATALIADLRRYTMAELEVASVVARMFALARKHHIRPMPELSLVLLGMVTIEGIAKHLDPGANTMSEVARYLAPRIAGGKRFARGTHRWSEPPLTMAAASPDAARASPPHIAAAPPARSPSTRGRG